MLKILLASLVCTFSWATEPAHQVIGSYSRGKIHQAHALPLQGKGFSFLSLSENRNWGSLGLIETLEKSAAEMIDFFPEFTGLVIGDLSAETGGPIKPHLSHQNGLDVDVYFIRTDGLDPKTSLVANGKLLSAFDLKKNWKFVKFLVSQGRINRIFADRAVKKSFCALYPSETEVLRRIRPFPSHEAHFHIRLTCPAESPECISQVEVPLGSGCSELELNNHLYWNLNEMLGF